MAKTTKKQKAFQIGDQVEGDGKTGAIIAFNWTKNTFRVKWPRGSGKEWLGIDLLSASDEFTNVWVLA